MSKNVSKYLSLCLIAGTLAAAPTAAWAKPPVQNPIPGSETGHGGTGDALGADYLAVPRHPAQWCDDFSWMVGEVFADAREQATLSDRRAALVAGIEGLISNYESNGMPYQPLTYQLLITARKLNAKFPAGSELGDRAAGILLTRMLETARVVNQEFDLPQFLPLVDAWGRCGSYHCVPYGHGWRRGSYGDADAMAMEFYTAYVESASAVVDMLFAPALNGLNFNVLEALAYDRWELEAASEILKFISSSLSKDLFARYFVCLRNHVVTVEGRLAKYLATTPPSPIQDRQKRAQIERLLGEIQTALKSVTYERSGARCGGGYRY